MLNLPTHLTERLVRRSPACIHAGSRSARRPERQAWHCRAGQTAVIAAQGSTWAPQVSHSSRRMPKGASMSTSQLPARRPPSFLSFLICTASLTEIL